AQMADEEARALARSGKNRLSRNERLELRDKIVRRLRKKLAPSTRTVDVVWDLDGGTVLFFSHSKRVLADFCALFERTFRLALDEDSPYRAALRANLPRALLRELDHVEPMALRRTASSKAKRLAASAAPPANGSSRATLGASDTSRRTTPMASDANGSQRATSTASDANGSRRAAPSANDAEDDPLRRIETTRFLGSEFLLWIWLRGELSTASIRLDGDTELDVWLDRQLTLESPIDKNERVTVRGMAPADAEEAREAVRAGKLPVVARIVLRNVERDFVAGLVAPRFGITGAKVPAVLKEDAGEAFIDRMALCEELFGMLDGLYRAFLLERLSDTWTLGWEPAIAAWAADESIPAAVLQKLAPPKRGKRDRKSTR